MREGQENWGREGIGIRGKSVGENLEKIGGFEEIPGERIVQQEYSIVQMPKPEYLDG
jgi:hypothetical protein